MLRGTLLVAVLILLTGPGYSQEKQPTAILQSVIQKWKSIQDYHCKMQSNNRLGDKTDKKKIEFWFKRKHQVRMQVLDGEKKGSALTRNDEGRIKGKKGGLLGVIAVTLDENDKRIFNLRGRKFYRADWGSVIAETVQRVKSGWRLRRLGDETFNGVPCFVLEATGKEPGSKVTRDMIWVDQTNHLVLRRKQYEGKTLVNEVAWWDIELNSNLDDDLFTL